MLMQAQRGTIRLNVYVEHFNSQYLFFLELTNDDVTAIFEAIKTIASYNNMIKKF